MATNSPRSISRLMSLSTSLREPLGPKPFETVLSSRNAIGGIYDARFMIDDFSETKNIVSLPPKKNSKSQITDRKLQIINFSACFESLLHHAHQPVENEADNADR